MEPTPPPNGHLILHLLILCYARTRIELDLSSMTRKQVNVNQAGNHPQSRSSPTLFKITHQTSTAKEIWDYVEMLMLGSGRTLQQREGRLLFMSTNRFRAIGTIILATVCWFPHELVNVMKILSAQPFPTHRGHMFIYTHLKLRASCQKDSQEKEQLQGFQKQFHNQQPLRTSPTQDSCYECMMVHIVLNNSEESSRNPRERWTLSTSKDNAFADGKKANEKGDVLVVKAEAFLADVECTALMINLRP
ncbi:hypothetical protein Tco_0874343 [Tanacetum coccineum]|uniref:Uncharacterized protein n=1 Tax=Tanacetum coccineum TaxID=301880 RepID=A0ABQ5BP72_9ASTR